MKKIINYFKGVGAEARRVRWPRKKLLWTSVAIVVSITVLSATIVFGEDFITVKLIKTLEELFGEAEATAVIKNLGGLL